MARVRDAREQDAAGIRDVIEATYGDHYPYAQFYDEKLLRRMIVGEDTLMLVAEEEEDGGRVIGCASVLLDVGAYSDLMGEFARLAVVPDWRHRGVGTALMKERLRRVRDRLHVGIVDARLTHPFSLTIAQHQGFVPVGFCPLKDLFVDRESTGILAQWFGDGLALRKNDPRIVPEIHALASVALDNAGLPGDAVVDDSSAPYPFGPDFEIQDLTTKGYSTLLRIERGRLRHREVFGPFRLHYGFFRLRASHADYIIARRGPRIAGAIGFLRDDVEKIVRIFELIAPDDGATRFLLGEIERRCREEWGTAYLEIEVRADAPRMQRTLIELGFIPTAYTPALVFHEVERLDIVRMARLLVPLELGELHLTPEMRVISEIVLAPLLEQQALPKVDRVVGASRLFEGLSREQQTRLAAICAIHRFERDDRIIQEGETGDALHLILEGRATIAVDGAENPVGDVSTGEAIGEMGLLAGRPHTATATADMRVETARFAYDDLEALIRSRPDIGVVIFRNMAAGIGRKLHRSDLLARR